MSDFITETTTTNQADQFVVFHRRDPVGMSSIGEAIVMRVSDIRSVVQEGPASIIILWPTDANNPEPKLRITEEIGKVIFQLNALP